MILEKEQSLSHNEIDSLLCR